MNRRKIKKAAVLGAGVMGSRIAALLAGVDIQTCLLDIVPKELDEKDKKKGLTVDSPAFRNKLASAGIDNALRAIPPAMFVARDAKLIIPGNFEDHMSWLSEVDWVIEVVAEDLNIKQALLRKAASLRMAIASAREARYGHPHTLVKRKVRQRRVPLLRTEDWGTIHLEL